MTLRLMRGSDTAAMLNVSGLPPGARLRLQELRVDGDSRYAFPRSVELDGADVVTVNGMRMASAGRVPREVDVRAAVLAWSSDVGALLVRPDDARMPDLRVVVGMATQVVGTDGGGADPVNIRPGDSVRVEGRSEDGYVIASRITVPTRIGEATVLEADPDAIGGNDGDADGDGAARAGTGGGSPSAAPAPVARARAIRGDDRPGKGNGRARGQEKGKGRGGGKERG
jgi:hypothetical protein